MTTEKEDDCLHTGTAAECRLTDALHPEKRENPPEEKVYFLSWRVRVFYVPVKLLFRFL